MDSLWEEPNDDHLYADLCWVGDVFEPGQEGNIRVIWVTHQTEDGVSVELEGRERTASMLAWNASAADSASSTGVKALPRLVLGGSAATAAIAASDQS